MSELIKSLSGIRGIVGKSITLVEAYKIALAFYGEYLVKNASGNRPIKIVIGKDPKLSGNILLQGVFSAIEDISKKERQKFELIYLGTATTPMIQWAIINYKAQGGIIITASHNPIEWNGIKLISGKNNNDYGTLLKPEQMQKIIDKFDRTDKEINFRFKPGTVLPKIRKDVLTGYNRDVLRKVKNVIDLCCGQKGKGTQVFDKIRGKEFKVIIDACSRSGAEFPKSFLLSIGILPQNIIVLNNNAIEQSNRPLEPVPQHLAILKSAIQKFNADIGFAFDPDQDRLVAMPLRNEEYTPLLAGKFLLELQKDNKKKYIKCIPVNLSTTGAWEEIAGHYGIEISRTPVGEINVVNAMINNKTVFGAEGNGGTILGTVNYGRNSTVGMALLLCYIAESGKSIAELEKEIPPYVLIKRKLRLANPKLKLRLVRDYYEKNNSVDSINNSDGYKILFKDNSWIHVRASNTEPLVRIIAEGKIEGKMFETYKKVNKLIQQTKSIMV